MTDLPMRDGPLADHLLAAAREFQTDAQPLGDILAGLATDVDRALAEPLEIMPVCHHSPSSAAHMIRRLRARAPRAIYMECCEDLRPLLDGLRECQLPVALQAFSSGSEAFPAAWSPLSLVCPITEFSAEFQAIAYALTHPETELVFVDRSADHVFQWMPQQDDALEESLGDEPEDDEQGTGLHGAALGVQMGAMEPTIEVFNRFLLQNARVQHYSEWWDQYVEDAIISGDYQTYRQVMFLIGSLFRRLGRRQADTREDEKRERFMWTRMKQHLAANAIDPRDAIYICGAAHSASYVEEFGVESPTLWDIPARTETKWLYGLLPSSYAAIEHQFGQPPGSATLAQNRWRTQLKHDRIKAFTLPKPSKESDKAATSAPAPASDNAPHPAEAAPDMTVLLGLLAKPPELVREDEEQLLANCVKVVGMARRAGYMSSTADSIAIYHTSVLLANLRNRKHPTAYDFRDAAITCLEKDSVPGKRDIARICDIALGGDRIGKVGYESMPPLARDIWDRLATLPIDLEKRQIQRALLDFRKNPEYLPASDLLWKLRYLLTPEVARPIIGQRGLGLADPVQESWDLALLRNQGQIIQLGYEGVTIEQVLERRLKKAAFGPDARCADALESAKDSILFLKSQRLTHEIGERAKDLLLGELDVKDAQEIYRRISELIHHYRGGEGLPGWCGDFVSSGYSHYCTLLPTAFADQGTKPEDLAGMLRFILTLESLALSLGCERSQLIIAIKQAGSVTTDPTKLSLLWSVECVLNLRQLSDVRAHFNTLLDNRLALSALPNYIAGFMLALSFTPIITAFTVELLSKAFAKLPDQILMPWLPSLLRGLRASDDTSLAVLLKEASAVFPKKLDALENWTPPWDAAAQRAASNKSASGDPSAPRNVEAAHLLRTHPEATDAWAVALGAPLEWREISGPPTGRGGDGPSATLLKDYPAAAEAFAQMMGCRSG